MCSAVILGSLLSVLLGIPSLAGAQSGVATSDSGLETDARERWAIRGCPLDVECNHAQLEASMLEFELERFPPPAKGSPWVKQQSSDAAIASARRRASKKPSLAPKKPSELDPKYGWMDNLKMPDLPVRWDHRIIAFLEFYKDDPRGRRIMGTWLKRQGRYRAIIATELRKAALPADLLYIAMIESSYDPHEYSRVGASGLWQFMPYGGPIFGLAVNRHLDERNDPVRSTQAVMLYWKDLYERFGDWDLAMAAFNAGFGAVLKGMAKYNSNDFWQLLEWENALPWESSMYVPKALAAAIVGNNRKAFGYGDIVDYPPMKWDDVTVPKTVSLSVIARASNASVADIEALNPQLRAKRTPPGVKNYRVRIPPGTRAMFAKRFAQTKDEWDHHDVYIVKHGQRFEDVATEFGIGRSELRKLNGVRSEAEVSGGTTLVVPRRSISERAANIKKAKDALYAGGVPKGKPGDKLVVALTNPSMVVKGRKRLFYRVVSGNSLWGIADAFGVGVGELAKWNGFSETAKIHPRMVLQVWVTKSFSPAKRKIAVLDPARLTIVKAGSKPHIDKSEKKVGRKRIVVKARNGDSLTSIGKKYGLTARDLARINKLPPNAELQIGQEVIVYKVVNPKASDRAAKQAKQAR